MNGAVAIAILAAVLLAAAAIVYLELRHIALTALVFATAAATAAASIWIAELVRHSGLEDSASAFVFAVTAGFIVAARVVQQICEGQAPRLAAAQARAEAVRTMGLVLLAMLPVALVLATNGRIRGLCITLSVAMLLAFGAALAASWPAAVLPYSEEFIARANRAREQRCLMAERLSAIAETRWALSVTGIAMILATLAGFAMRGLHFYNNDPPLLWLYFPAVPLLLFAGFAAVARDWRLALAAALTMSLAAALALAAFAASAHPFGDVMTVWSSFVLVIAAAPLALLASHAGRQMRAQAGCESALPDALRRHGPLAASVAAVCAVLWIPFALMSAILRWPLTMAAASIAAPLLFCALAATLYTLLPRYRSVEEVFGKR